MKKIIFKILTDICLIGTLFLMSACNDELDILELLTLLGHEVKHKKLIFV